MQVDDMQLNDYEIQLVRKHRAEVKAKADALEMRVLVLSTALAFERWLQKSGEGHSYSSFVNQFGYQDKESNKMYAQVCLVLNSIDQ
jgi:hypothetical protein